MDCSRFLSNHIIFNNYYYLLLLHKTSFKTKKTYYRINNTKMASQGIIN